MSHEEGHAELRHEHACPRCGAHVLCYLMRCRDGRAQDCARCRGFTPREPA